MRVLKISVLVLMVLFLAVGISYAQTAKEYHNKGIEYAVQGKFEEAEEEFKKALKTDQFYNPAKECSKLLEDASKKGIENEAVIHFFKGMAYDDKGMFDKAILEYKRAIAINPNDAKAHNNLGAIYGNNGMYDTAILESKKAIAINSNYADAHNNLAVSYYYKKQYKLAIEHCDKARELGYSVHPALLEYLKPYRK